jgi:hypothetical protein
MSLKLEGVYSVLPTAFTSAGDLDDASLRRVVDPRARRERRDGLAPPARWRGQTTPSAAALEVVTSQVASRIGVVATTAGRTGRA